MTVYVDTHVLVWIGKGELEHLSPSAHHALANDDLLVSPAAVLELEFLHEIGRLKISAEKLLAALQANIDLRVCDLPFRDVVAQAVKESWTRDPFDRLIVANAKAADAPLVSKDENIRKHYRRAIW
ncbi:MAG TPA: PIN domain-containing protein [Bryobacteraceae bacterium]|jgi:PIN domain nuclease of toxin-antitoxin system|nr:PIN domain-containing protein [Bryobacteraceae bacterium]